MKMTQEEMKQKLLENALDIAVAIGVFTRGTLTVEADLQEAKSSAKNLIEKIDEYLESSKPKFEVGDYVVQYDNYITKIDEIDEIGYLIGRTYRVDVRTLVIPKNYVVSKTARIATPEEILEYEAALNFHKHGRKPFELKWGDLIKDGNSNRGVVVNPYIYIKEMFYKSGYELLATAEEVNEWLENK